MSASVVVEKQPYLKPWAANADQGRKMENLSQESWSPTLLFALLALYFLQKALRPKARRNWGWGRGGGSVPVSRSAYVLFAVTFLVIAGLLAWAPGPPPACLVALLMFCFLAIIGVGFRDTWSYRRGRDPSNSGEGDQNK
jgi:hypothetical protein